MSCAHNYRMILELNRNALIEVNEVNISNDYDCGRPKLRIF